MSRIGINNRFIVAFIDVDMAIQSNWHLRSQLITLVRIFNETADGIIYLITSHRRLLNNEHRLQINYCRNNNAKINFIRRLSRDHRDRRLLCIGNDYLNELNNVTQIGDIMINVDDLNGFLDTQFDSYYIESIVFVITLARALRPI